MILGKEIARKDINALSGRQAKTALKSILEGSSLCEALEKAKGS